MAYTKTPKIVKPKLNLRNTLLGLGFLNAGNTKASCESLMKYVFAGDCKEGQNNCVLTANGKWKLKLNGLVERRELEMKYCLGEVKTNEVISGN